MNYREAALYANKTQLEVKAEFEGILDAMGSGLGLEVLTTDLIEFWLNGSIPANYDLYIKKLHGADVLLDNGIPKEYTALVLSSESPIDKFIFFKNVCLKFIGEEPTADFKALIVDPIIKMYIEPMEQNKKIRIEKIAKAKTILFSISPALNKIISEVEKIEPNILTGTNGEAIFYELLQPIYSYS